MPFEIADCHHVVQPVDADALCGQPVADVLAGALREDLVLDPRRSVLADVAGLCREDDRRVSFTRQDHVGVAMDDHEAGHVRDGALEPGVLGAADDDGVELLLGHRLADGAVASFDLGRAHHDCSKPFTSDQIARFNGVGIPCSSPNRTIPPFR